MIYQLFAKHTYAYTHVAIYSFLKEISSLNSGMWGISKGSVSTKQVTFWMYLSKHDRINPLLSLFPLDKLGDFFFFKISYEGKVGYVLGCIREA